MCINKQTYYILNVKAVSFEYLNTVFPPSTHAQRLFNFEAEGATLIGGRSLERRCAYIKVR